MLLTCAGAAAQLPQTIPVDQIKPGMTGYGLTVFYGYKVERFKVEVVDVLHKFLPKQDLVLIKIDHPRLRKTGTVGGMSGSPIYLNGKLAGALAYGWRFAKEPIAGMTPIADMLALLKRKPRGPARAGFASTTRRQQRALLAALQRRPAREHWRLPFRPIPRARGSVLTPVTVPLSAAGFPAASLKLLRSAFSAYGFEPVQGGGMGKASGPRRYVKGGAVAVQLVNGDMALTGTGTVTWAGVRRVLGFGHRMFNAGEIYIPALTARINHTLASVSRSFKLSSPARVVGALVQDRQPGILVDPSRTVRTVPMTVTMRHGSGKRVFRAELAHHRLLTPTLATTVLSSALSEALADVANATITVTTRFKVKGYPRVKLVDHLFSSSGARMAAVLFSRGLRALRAVMDNDFAPAPVERIDVDVQVSYAKNVVTISGVSLSSITVDPGARVNLTVSFEPFGGPEFTRTYPLTIPRSMGGSVLIAEVSSGDKVKPDLAPPENLGQFLNQLQAGYPARSMVLSLRIPSHGLKLRGHVIRDLPLSVLDALNTGTRVRSGALFRTAYRRVFDSKYIVQGNKKIRIRVRSEVDE